MIKYIIIFLAILSTGCMSRFNTKHLKCKIVVSLPTVNVTSMKILDITGHPRVINNITAMQYVSGRCN